MVLLTHDVRHQLNSNFVWDLPVGRGKKVFANSSRLADEILGGWQTTGIVRWTSGFPFLVNNGAYYPTNWDIQGYARTDRTDSFARQRAWTPDAALR